MLKISKQQLDHVITLKIEKFYRTVKNYLQTYYADDYLLIGSKAAQSAWVKDVVKRAQAYGMETESDILAYVRAAITFSKDVNEQHWAKEILQKECMPSTKARLLQDAMMAELENMTLKSQQTRDQLLHKKVTQYAHEKADYVLSFDVFYGLGLNNSIQNATQWLQDTTAIAVSYDFTDDFLLDSYLEVALYFGKNFHTESWAHDILISEQSSAEKISALLAYLAANFGKHDVK